MNELIAKISNCRRCRLWRGARNPVPGEGNLNASLMIIGEAPGYLEDVQGRPFVGAAGKLLDKLLSSINLSRREVYIGNIVKHRPPLNRDPRPDEIEVCAPYLDKQIEIIKPKIIVPLGRHSAMYILSKVNVEIRGISEVRGKIYVARRLNLPIRIMPTFHPAVALYKPGYISTLEEDFKKIKAELEKLQHSS